MTALDGWRVRIVRGDGLVARLGSVTCVALPETPEQSEVAGAVLALARDAGPRGRDLARRIAGLLREAESADTPPFAVVAPDGDEVVVLVHGAIDVAVTAAGETEHVSGRHAATWADRVFAGPVERIEIGSGEVIAAPRTDLHGGIVVGAGAVLAAESDPIAGRASTDEPTALAPAIAAAPPPPPQHGDVGRASVPAEQDVVVVSLSDASEADLGVREPLAVAGDAHVASPLSDATGPRVQGILCSRQHFNDPNALYCRVCGISMVQRTHNLVDGDRPPLGVLVRDDGATFVLDSDYVIGRDPSGDAAVSSGAASALRLDDPDRTISRVHARVALRSWDVTVADAGSANGTFHASAGSSEWTRVAELPGVVLKPGTLILIGQRTFVFETNRRR